jgi:hypothetical protein
LLVSLYLVVLPVSACLGMLQSLLVRKQMWSIWLQSNIALPSASIANMHADKVVMRYRRTTGMIQ